jgi:retron-type reverse transcriptase
MIHNLNINNVNDKKTAYDSVTSLEGLFSAWSEFKKGKIGKLDVQQFFLELEVNLIGLFRKIKSGNYKHSNYISFFICDPKLRNINKAEVSDRVLHHSIVKHIEPLFERSYIFDSYSSRDDKGTHRAIKRLKKFSLTITKNKTKTAWALKCDIKKFFDSIDHEIMLLLVREKIKDRKLMEIIEEIIRSYSKKPGKGIPLGNLTSQLFSNVYLNKFDHFVKRELKVKHYIRYADDFVILDTNRERLEKLVPVLDDFLETRLKLTLHPDKIIIRKIHQGIDFLGAVVFPTYIILRTKTKNRMFRKIKARKKELRAGLIDRKTFSQSLQSYYGMLTHCRGKKNKNKILKIIAN